MPGLLERRREAEGEADIAQFVFAVDAELDLGRTDLLHVGDSPCPFVVGVRVLIEVFALVDEFPFHHEVAHERVQDAALRGEIQTQVERLEVDARHEILRFGSEVVAGLLVEVFVLRVDAGVFTVDAEDGNDVIACVGGNPVSRVGRMLNRVPVVGAVTDLDLEREGEFHVFFDADVAPVCVDVLRGKHDVEVAEPVNPADFNSVVAVIAHPETALGEVLVEVGTEVGGLRPVGFPATGLQAYLVLFTESPLVFCPVEVGENLVLCGLAYLGDVAVFVRSHVRHVLVAEFRGVDAEHDKPFEAFALVLASHVGADPAAADVVFFVSDGLGKLRLDVSLEAEAVVGRENGAGHARDQEHACNSGELHGGLLFEGAVNLKKTSYIANTFCPFLPL